MGGQGTRLRPLTSTVPKPVVQLVDRPFISFMLEWLRGHGVDDVIMSCGFLARRCARCSATARRGHPPALRRGARAAGYRRRAEAGRADARRALPDAQRRRAHRPRPDPRRSPSTSARARGHARARPCRGPLGLRVVLPRRGSGGARVRREAGPRRDRHQPDQRRRVRLERSMLELVPPERNVSIEREVWPQLVGDGLYGFASESYWLDIGTPERYLQGTFDILEGNVRTAVPSVWAPGCSRSTRAPTCAGGRSPRRGRARGPRARGRPRGEPRGARRGREHRRRVRGRAGGRARRASRRRCELRDCIVAAGCAMERDRDHRRSGARRGRQVGADNVITRGARIFPGVQLPDGAIEF